MGFCLQRLYCGWNRCSIPTTSQVRAQVIPGAFNTRPTCQSYQSMSSRHKSPLLTLFSSQAGLARWVVPKMFNGTFNALPVMVCKHFPKMVLFEVSNAFFPPAEIHTQTFKKVHHFRGKGMFHRPWSDWSKRILHWDGLLSWWAFVMHQFWAMEKWHPSFYWLL